jgi:hypothetical protein
MSANKKKKNPRTAAAAAEEPGAESEVLLPTAGADLGEIKEQSEVDKAVSR